MQRVLIFGDLHIPTRATSIPEVFKQHIETTKYDLALITGDLINEAAIRESLPDLPQCLIVQGNMDFSSSYPLYHDFEVEDFHFLLLHGTQLSPRGNVQQLWEISQKIGADVTVHGHTHNPAIDLYKHRLFLNPGTITGATGGTGGRKDASFLELEIQNSQIKVSLFVTNWEVFKTSQVEFRKVDNAILRK